MKIEISDEKLTVYTDFRKDEAMDFLKYFEEL